MPISFGSIILPIVIWMAPGISMTKVISQGFWNCANAMGRGSSVAMIEPMDGMKLSRKAITPKTGANCNPNAERVSQTKVPVIIDTTVLVVMYLLILWMMSA